MRIRFLIIFLFLISLCFAYEISQEESAFSVINQKSDCIEIEFNLPDYQFEAKSENGNDYLVIKDANSVTTSEVGKPELPVYSTLISIPATGSISMKIINIENEFRQINNEVYPFQGFDNESSDRFHRNADFYDDDITYPEDVVLTDKPAIMRDLRIVKVSVHPFAYNPVKKNIEIRNNIKIKIDINSNKGVNEISRYRKISRSFQKLYSSTVLNYEPPTTRDEYQERSILIVYKSEVNIEAKLNKFVNWKKQKGFDVQIADPLLIGESNSSTKTYIQNAYDTWENPPEYIIIIGDTDGPIHIPTWSDGYDWTNGAGDVPYTQLEGNDILPDAFIGRLSVSGSTEFNTAINKILDYEINPNMEQLEWYDHNLLVGDTAPSGQSCIYTNKYVKEKMSLFNPDYSFTEIYDSQPSPNLMNNALNSGSLIFHYRGYIGMSGWDSNSIGSLTNTDLLFNAVILTCDTGSFDSWSPSRTELLLRSGTPSAPTGSITATGMSTAHTNTRCNNILSGGIFDGLFTYNMQTMGEAVNKGRVSVYEAYNHAHPDMVNAFVHWINLIGDPTLDIWKTVPQYLNVQHNEMLNVGDTNITIHVSDDNDNPMNDSWVTLYQENEEILASGYTDENGEIILPIPIENDLEVILTVSNPNYIPYVDTLFYNSESFVGYLNYEIDDTINGNGDGVANSGENLNINVNIKNYSSETISNLSGELSTNNEFIEVINSSVLYPDLASNETAYANEQFSLNILPGYIGVDPAVLYLTLSDDNRTTYQITFMLEIVAGSLEFSEIDIQDSGNGILDPSETSEISVTLSNLGGMDLSGISATVSCDNAYILFEDSLAYFGDIDSGADASCNSDNITITAMSELIPGMQIIIDMELSNENGFYQQIPILLNIGETTEGDPIGPDAYGYFCYDDEDSDYDNCPEYNWIEIAPQEGGNGELLGFADTETSGTEGEEVGSVTLVNVDLPFNFSFYGIAYNNITVCSNGFIAFGETENGSFRNWHLPGPLGPAPMVAAFWDDLIIDNNGGVYTYYDDIEDIFIIEWYEASNAVSLSNKETFQIILYSPTSYPGPMGNAPIKIQYKEFNNVNQGGSGIHGNYCTVGIENIDSSTGLEYTFNNEYPVAAKPLEDETAILFALAPETHENAYLLLGRPAIHDNADNTVINPGETINLGIELFNFGLSDAEDVSVTINNYDEYVTLDNNFSEYPIICAEEGQYNIDFFTFDVSNECPNNFMLTFNVNVESSVDSWQYVLILRVYKPSVSVQKNRIYEIAGNNDGIPDPGESIAMAVEFQSMNNSEIENLNIELISNHPDVDVNYSSVNIPKILKNSTHQVVFLFDIDDTVPAEDEIEFSLSFSSDDIEDIEETISIFVSVSSFLNDFESDNGGFTGTGSWQWGHSNSMGAHSGANVWGTNLNGNYTDNANWYLTSPEVTLTAGSMLSFYHKYEIENNWDGGQVQISTNSGASWEIIYPQGGYTHDSVNALNGPGFSDNLSTWQEVIFDLSEYASSEAMIRWYFASDGSQTRAGWFIDDVNIDMMIEPGSIISGAVELNEGNGEIGNTLLTVDNINSYPTDGGMFTFILPEGEYNLNASYPGYSSVDINNISLEAGDYYDAATLSLNYLQPAENLQVNGELSEVELTWEYAENINRVTTTKRSIRDDFEKFYIYKQSGGSNFTLVDSTTELYYNDTVSNGLYRYYIIAKYDTGLSLESNHVEHVVTNVDIAELEIDSPKFALYGNYPNPFNPETNIHFSIAENSEVQIKIYNIKGQVVKNLLKKKLPIGNHFVTWDGTNNEKKAVTSGVYFYKISTKKFTDIRKALLLK